VHIRVGEGKEPMLAGALAAQGVNGFVDEHGKAELLGQDRSDPHETERYHILSHERTNLVVGCGGHGESTITEPGRKRVPCKCGIHRVHPFGVRAFWTRVGVCAHPCPRYSMSSDGPARTLESVEIPARAVCVVWVHVLGVVCQPGTRRRTALGEDRADVSLR